MIHSFGERGPEPHLDAGEFGHRVGLASARDRRLEGLERPADITGIRPRHRPHHLGPCMDVWGGRFSQHGRGQARRLVPIGSQQQDFGQQHPLPAALLAIQLAGEPPEEQPTGLSELAAPHGGALSMERVHGGPASPATGARTRTGCVSDEAASKEPAQPGGRRCRGTRVECNKHRVAEQANARRNARRHGVALPWLHQLTRRRPHGVRFGLTGQRNGKRLRCGA